MTRWYLDTSVALHAVLPFGDERAAAWIDSAFRRGDEIYSSTLLQLEITRALRREQFDLSYARPVIDRVALVGLDDSVLLVAGAIASHIKSLDAIHLATRIQLGSAVTVVTHDAEMLAVAESLGLDSVDPLASR